MLRQRLMVHIPAIVRMFIEGRRHDARLTAARRPGRMRYISGLLGIMMMWGNSSPLAAQEVSTPEATVAAQEVSTPETTVAAQEASTTNATVAADTGAETVAGDAVGQAAGRRARRQRPSTRGSRR